MAAGVGSVCKNDNLEKSAPSAVAARSSPFSFAVLNYIQILVVVISMLLHISLLLLCSCKNQPV